MNLILSRHGIWYSRFTYLLPSGKRKEIRKSLRTRCKLTARRMVRDMRLVAPVQCGHSQPEQVSSQTSPAPTLSVLKLSKAIELWLSERRLEGLGERELKRIKTYLELLLKTVGNKRIESVRRVDANRFKDALVASDKSITTINNYLKRAKALYSWLGTRIDDLKNPFEGLLVKQLKAPSEQRQAFTTPEFERLQEACVGLPAYKQMIIQIACYTGMRQNEICQLYKNDIKQVGGVEDRVWIIDVNDSRPDQRLKNAASRRQIPISNKLVDAGLLEWVGVGGGVDQPLFPELKHCPSRGRARYFTKWYGEWRKRNELPEFHSIRHTVATKLKSAGIAEQFTAQLLGHAAGGMTYGRYGKQVGVEQLGSLVDLL